MLEAIPAGDRVLGGGVVEPSVGKDDILLGVQGIDRYPLLRSALVTYTWYTWWYASILLSNLILHHHIRWK